MIRKQAFAVVFAILVFQPMSVVLGESLQHHHHSPGLQQTYSRKKPFYRISPSVRDNRNAFISHQALRVRGGTTTTEAASKATLGAASTAAATGFFGSIRIPATLVLGSSLAGIFSCVGYDKKLKEGQMKNTWERAAFGTCLGTTIASLILSMLTILTATVTGTLLMLGKYDATGYIDTYHYLRDVFNFEFLLTRWSFLLSLMTFSISVSCRAFLEFDLLKGKRTNVAIFTSSCCVAILSHMISFVNGNLNCWDDFGGLTVELGQEFLKRAVSKPMAGISLFAILFSIASGVRAIMMAINNKEEQKTS